MVSPTRATGASAEPRPAGGGYRVRGGRLQARHRARAAADEERRRPIALTGKVFCKVDAGSRRSRSATC